MSASLHLLDGRRANATDGSGRESTAPVPVPVNKARLAIVAEMRELNRPATSKELYARLDRAWSLKAIEFHLSVLVRKRVVKIVVGRELLFSLVDSEGGSRD
jgi:hypothetical protein